MSPPSLLRSAASRVLRRSSPQAPFPRSPRVFFSGVAGRTGPCKPPYCTDGGRSCCMLLLRQFEEQVREVRAVVDSLMEEQQRFERNERLQKKIACVLVPATLAFYVFGPKKKLKSSAEGQPDSL